MNNILRLFSIIAVLSFCNAQASSFGIRELDLPSDCQITIKGVDNENRVYGFIESASIPTSGFQLCLDGTMNIIPYPKSFESYQPPVMNKRGEIAGIRWKQTTPWISKVTKFKSLFTIDTEGTITDLGFPSEWPNPRVPLKKDFFLRSEKAFSIIAFNENNQLIVANAALRSEADRFAVCSSEGSIDLELTKAYAFNNNNKVLGRKDLRSNRGPISTLVLYDIQSGKFEQIVPDEHVGHRLLNDRGLVAILQTPVAVQVLQTMKADHKTDVECHHYFLEEQKNNPGHFTPEAFLWDSITGMRYLKEFLPLCINNRGHMVGIKKTDSLKAEFTAAFLSAFSSIPSEPLCPNNITLIDADNSAIDLYEILKIGAGSDWSRITTLYGMNDRDSMVGEGLYKGAPAFFLITRNEIEDRNKLFPFDSIKN